MDRPGGEALKRILLAALCLALYAATPTTTVTELIALVRSEMRDGEADASLAKSLHKLKLSERLDLRVVEELESEGAGEKSIEELLHLRDESIQLAPPAGDLPFQEPAAPQMDELRRVLTDAQNFAIAYTKSLPDFICTQVVHRYDSPGSAWRLSDTLEIKLSYFGNQEDYKLLTVNGRSTVLNYSAIGGALSKGEFGSMLVMVFDAKSHAEFHWANWTKLRKRTAYVLSFYIRAENSAFHLDFQRSRGQGRFSTISAQRGFLWIDQETHRIVRLYREAVEIPKSFPVISSSSLLDYESTTIGASEFLLPLRADVRIASRDLVSRNLVEFRDYRKFAAETSISFDPK